MSHVLYPSSGYHIRLEGVCLEEDDTPHFLERSNTLKTPFWAYKKLDLDFSGEKIAHRKLAFKK